MISAAARDFAVKAHEGQMYGENEPYTVHLDVVAAIVGPSPVLRAIAYLHDVMEDTPVKFSEVRNMFGQFVAECVSLLTDEAGKNRKERKAASHAKLARVEPSHHAALVVKVADRVANVEACVMKGNEGLLQMYRKEQEAFKAAAYRQGLCDHLWARIDAALEATQ